MDWSWIRPKPVEQSGEKDLSSEDSPTVMWTCFQTRRPSGDDDPGEVEIVHYVVAGDVVKLCSEDGALTGKTCQLKAGDDARGVAARLGRDAWSATRGNDFNRELPRYNGGWR